MKPRIVWMGHLGAWMCAGSVRHGQINKLIHVYGETPSKAFKEWSLYAR